MPIFCSAVLGLFWVPNAPFGVKIDPNAQAGAVGQAPGPNFGRKPAKNRGKLKYLILPTGPYRPFGPNGAGSCRRGATGSTPRNPGLILWGAPAAPIGPYRLLFVAVHWQFVILIFPVFGRFSANLGPKTPLERRGSSCSAGCTKSQPRTPILRPFRGTSGF